jgi:hypothetical protein
VEFQLLGEDLETLDKLAGKLLTTRGDLIREALFNRFAELRENDKRRWTEAYERSRGTYVHMTPREPGE